MMAETKLGVEDLLGEKREQLLALARQHGVSNALQCFANLEDVMRPGRSAFESARHDRAASALLNDLDAADKDTSEPGETP